MGFSNYPRMLIAVSVTSLLVSGWYSWQYLIPPIEDSPMVSRPLAVRYLVDTPGCKIPAIDPFDKSVSHLIDFNPKPVLCDALPAITYTDHNAIRINRTALAIYYADGLDYCEYQSVERIDDRNSDNLYEYSSRVIRFSRDVNVTSEFIRVACYGESGDMIYANFHAFVLRKPEVERRCDRKSTERSAHVRKENLNVIALGVDSVSRLNFIRQMSRTRDFLLDTLGAIEMAGLQQGGRQHDFSARGYRTMYAEDAPTIAIFNYVKEGFYRRPADYYLRPLSLAMEDHGSLWTADHDCIGDKLETDIVLDWVRDFVVEFKEERHLAFAFITRLTHESLNKAASADASYVNFLRRLHDAGSFDNSVLLFYSDHGIRFGPIRQTFVGKLEERLPFMYWVFPPWFRRRYPRMWRNLRTNARRLTTPFDVYETLKDVLDFDGVVPANDVSRRGLSLLAEVPAGRTCEHAAIAPHWCTCDGQRATSRSDPRVVEAGRRVVAFINRQLRQHRGRCSVLRLANMTDALMTADRGASAKRIVRYLLTLRTTPGGGLFEATVHHVVGEDSYEIMDEISRINRYGNQSHCIEYHRHKKFCHCP
ncbi:hypothetical protein NP493_210g03014 [Ridgeia piscesae]|uniref:Uncharacterized protein n=1 Tax=Ridgeia piscesae TaxID=27915 RepID=A0AAD9P171_RIDPI|nr:hypothetical protein NP493_210g03014 [Ridgeia piscesae]